MKLSKIIQMTKTTCQSKSLCIIKSPSSMRQTNIRKEPTSAIDQCQRAHLVSIALLLWNPTEVIFHLWLLVIKTKKATITMTLSLRTKSRISLVVDIRAAPCVACTVLQTHTIRQHRPLSKTRPAQSRVKSSSDLHSLTRLMTSRTKSASSIALIRKKWVTILDCGKGAHCKWVKTMSRCSRQTPGRSEGLMTYHRSLETLTLGHERRVFSIWILLITTMLQISSRQWRV